MILLGLVRGKNIVEIWLKLNGEFKKVIRVMNNIDMCDVNYKV